MRKSMLIKVPTLLAVAAILAFGSGRAAWEAAALAFLAGAGLIGWFVFNPNAGFWAPTLWRAPRPRGAVALTFDDGPDPAFTPRVLEILAEKKVPAAFFVVGERARANAGLLAAMDEAGHVIGNHTDTHHLTFHFRLWRRVRQEIDRCNAAIRAAVGREPLLFRSPQGFKAPALGDVLRERGMTAVGWQVRGLDAVSSDAGAIVARIARGAEPGGVITLHDGAGLGGTRDRRATIEALPRLIDALRARGLDFVRLDDLLGVPAYRDAIEGSKPPAPRILSRGQVPYVEETRIGTWFLRTETWREHVIRVALDDLERLIPDRSDRYPAILDVGCGHGAALAMLDERFAPDRIVGVDADLDALELAASAAGGCRAEVELRNVSVAHTGLPDRSFDMIFCHQSFHHLSDHEESIVELYRLLKPGGILLFAESTRAYIHSWNIRIFFRHPMDVQKSSGEYLALLRATGFTVRPESVSCPYLWWSRWDVGALEWWGFRVPGPGQREETLINAVAVKPA